ncbi:DeoR/GlpR family DNA-binding transcription regulator [Pontibacillus litoralis]|uniref:Transcriptional regulator n=1 Tax=Pontibacillus litoralis JSM 072002 TaxID=1385512 RepID=A0A0A5G447_9BACI|nr:DeoR/GlpR family DNA-binding transcription regulator [Pontibacillus litoralis]KGX85860.1 transcriptional regulator [Pontibacillus litoralis JSM 072002]
MNKEERHQYIVDQLVTHEKIMVADLAQELNVTPETIRRDLGELEMNDQLTRVHGGAIRYIPTNKELAYERKMSIQYEEKVNIAKKAATYIGHGDTIVVDVGTTTVHIADMLEDIHSLTVVTNSLSAAQRFNLAIEEKRISGQVIMLPGFTHPDQASVKGAYTVEMLRRFHFNRAFISCGGITEDGMYDFDMDESLISEVMMQNSQEAILLIDSSKINKDALFKIGPCSSLTKVISDVERPVDWKQSNYEWVSTDDTLREER